jgi:MscS family membrane protein
MYLERAHGELEPRVPAMNWLDVAVVGTAIVGCGIVGSVAGRVSHYVIRRFAAHTSFQWDDALIGALRGPLMLGLFVAALRVAIAVVPVPPIVVRDGPAIIAALVYVAVFYALVRLVDAARTGIERSRGPEHPDALGLIQIGGRLIKLCLVILCILALLSHFGFSVATLIAGLGLGGLAIGLAAQKTLGNLFGGVSLALDQPFRTGDYVRIGELTGTVETIGLRSTAVRTLDRTLVSIPNGDLADARIESFTARDRLRLSCTLGLVYSTSPATIRRIVAEIERSLRDHPKIWPETIIVRFAGFGPSSLDIEIMAWFELTDWTEFLGLRQRLYLKFMDIIEAAGSSFAFPTQTIHVVRDAMGDAAIEPVEERPSPRAARSPATG